MVYVIEIPRPVNPTGFSFIKVVNGALIHQYGLKQDDLREISKALQHLGFKIKEKYGDRLIKGKVVVDLDKRIIKLSYIEVYDVVEKAETDISVIF